MATIRKRKLNVGKLKAVFDGMNNDALAAAKEAANLVLERAIPLTPMKTGALRDSGRVEVTGTAQSITAKIIFGDNNEVDYAAVVHEDLEPKEFTEPGTGPKYLETAFDQSLDDIQNILVTAVNKDKGIDQNAKTFEGDE